MKIDVKITIQTNYKPFNKQDFIESIEEHFTDITGFEVDNIEIDI